MKTKTHVYFGVFGFGDDPEVVTEILRMPPTEAWVKGEPYGALSAGARRTHSRWSLSGGLDEAAPVEAHLHALLGKLDSKRDEIRAVSQRFEAQVVVAQYFYEANPQFRMESDTLRCIADLGVPLYFDQYCLGEKEDC